MHDNSTPGINNVNKGLTYATVWIFVPTGKPVGMVILSVLSSEWVTFVSPAAMPYGYMSVNTDSRSTRATWLSTKTANQQEVHGYQHRQQVNKGYMSVNTTVQQGLYGYQRKEQVNRCYMAINTDSRSTRVT